MSFDLKNQTPKTTLPSTGILFGADSPSAADPSTYTKDSIIQIQKVNNISTALKGLPVSTVFDVNAAGYYTAGDGGGGMFYGVTGAPAGTYVDNGGTVILPTGGDGSSAWLRYQEPTISVKAFGAKGDGVTDATARIQAAVNAWKSIEIPAGNTFLVTSVINVPDDVYISGPGTIFVNQSPYYVNCFRTGSGVTFDGVVFRGATNPAEISPTLPGTSNYYGKAIACYNVNDVVIKNCDFYDFRDFGFNVSTGIIGLTLCHNVKILNNYFESSNYGQMDINAPYRTGDLLVDGNTSYSNSDLFLFVATLYDDISSSIKFPNSANHIVTNNILIKSRWNVPLVPISQATFQGTLALVGGKYILTVTSAVTGTIAPLQTLSGIISSTSALPPGTLIQSPGVAAGTWEVYNPYLPSGVTIPTFSTPIDLTSAVGASFTGTIANNILTIDPATVTGYVGSSQWIFTTPPAAALPEGTKISTSTAKFTGYVAYEFQVTAVSTTPAVGNVYSVGGVAYTIAAVELVAGVGIVRAFGPSAPPAGPGTLTRTSPSAATISYSSVASNKLVVTAMTGFLLANGTETIYGQGIPPGTVVASQDALVGTTQGQGLLGVYTLTNPGPYPLSHSYPAREIYVNNRWNVLTSNPTLTVTSVSMTSRSTDIGRHGIVAHYDSGISYLNVSNNFIGNVARHGVYLRGSTNKSFDSVGPDNISDNYFVYCGNGQSDGFSYASGIRDESSLPSNVSSNYFYKTGFYPNNTPGVLDAQDIECVRGLSNSIIAYNTCVGAKNGGVYINMSIPNSRIDNAKIIGNTIQSGQLGIAYGAQDVTDLVQDIQILDNHITLTGADYGTSAAPRSAGILADVSTLSTQYSLRINGNTVVGTGIGASFTGTISGTTLTASSITGAIASGQKLEWQTASFTLATIANNILTVGSSSVVTGTILANGTELLSSATGGFSATPIIMYQLPPVGSETPGGQGRYVLSVTTGTVSSRTMTSRIVDATAVSPMATFLGSISNSAKTGAGTILFVTEMGSGTIVPGGAVPPAIDGLGVTVTPGTTIASQITPLIAGESIGGIGRYNVSGAAQFVSAARMSITNVWNLSGSYSATAVAMTSSSNSYGIVGSFGTDNFASTSLVTDNTLRGVRWGIASWRFISNIPNYLPHKILGFQVVWDRNRFVSCDNALFVPKQLSTVLAMVGVSNIFDSCTNVNAPSSLYPTNTSLGQCLGQDSSGQFLGEWLASAPPSAEQVYYVGDRVLNSAPSNGNAIGWVCTGLVSFKGTITGSGTSRTLTIDSGLVGTVTIGTTIRWATGYTNPVIVTAGGGLTWTVSTAAGLTNPTNVDMTGATWLRYGVTILTGVTTYDPPSLVDGDGTTTTVTVTGAALGDYVTSVSFSLDVQGITVTGWVSAADTVSVRFQNETGGTIDLGSGTLRVVVTKA